MAEYLETLFQEITAPQKRAFLAAYAHMGRITHAAKSAQVGWRMHYHWIKNDALYAKAFAEAKRMAGDFLEDEAIRRAKDGIQKPIFWQGEHVDNVTEYSDTLLIFLLKGAKPAQYRERVEHTGADGAPLIPPSAPTPDSAFFRELAILFQELGPIHANGTHALGEPDPRQLPG